MIAPATRYACQPCPNQPTKAAVARTVAASSAATRASGSTAMYLGTSASTACKGGDGSLADVASSLAPALDTRSSAVSALEHSPANSASTAAATISQPMTGLTPRRLAAVAAVGRASRPRRPRPGTAVGPPRAQQPVLETEHRRVLGRVGVV